MKRLAFVLALVALLTMTASVAAAAAPAGYYSTDISGAKPAALNGHWTIAFAAHGRYAVSRNGSVVIRGSDTTSGKTLTLRDTGGPARCAATQTGMYTFVIKGSTLTLKSTHDACAARRAILTTHALHIGK